ncbi:MAG: penicillin acylase family protein, partial [Thermoanaerobaculia bacterium]|nr:penicillin acylase family protein [Thermoanaerobaculia bacterium]
RAVSVATTLLAARCRSAEVLGRARVAADRRCLSLRIPERAAATWELLSPELRQLIEGYADGYNAWLGRHGEALPDWVAAITPLDVHARSIARMYLFAVDLRGEVSALDRTFARAADAASGSNCWALAPSRTESGAAQLLINPHLSWVDPDARYYEAHLVIDGELDAYGAMPVGAPVFTHAFNRHLGWAHTVNYPDLEEIYVLERSADGDAYRLDGAWMPIERRRETLAVAGEQHTTLELAFTGLGPVLRETESAIYVLRNSTLEEYRLFEQWLDQARATSLSEFRDSLDALALPLYNICYADAEGNILYLWGGRVPRLADGPDHAQPQAVATSKWIWTELHPIAELPQIRNPPSGYVVNSNNPPYHANLASALDRAEFPAYFPDAGMSQRAQQGHLLLAGDDRLGFDGAVRRKHDTRVVLADQVLEALLTGARNRAGLDQAVRVLEAWDRRADAGSRGAHLFATWWRFYRAAVLGLDWGELADGTRSQTRRAVAEAIRDTFEVANPRAAAAALEARLFAEVWRADAPLATPRGLGDPERAARSLASAVTHLSERGVPLDVAWGDVHRFRLGTLDLPHSGAGDDELNLFRSAWFEPDADGRQAARGGDSFVMLVELSDPPKARSVLAYGQADDASRPDVEAAGRSFVAGELKPVRFERSEIERAAVRRYSPRP